MVSDDISSNIDEVLLINQSAMVFVFGDFNVHDEDWLTYSGGTDRPGELCYNFSISNDLTQMVNVSAQIPDCDFFNPALLDLLFLFLYFFSLHREILVMLLSQFPLTLCQTQKKMPCFNT